MISLKINGKPYNVEEDPKTPLLWILRDIIGLTGTKYGCGIGQCGACSVLIDEQSRRACMLPIEMLDGKSITTIEGLSDDSGLHPVQKAWIEHDVPQCGYCQSGQIISAVALLENNPNPSEAQIKTAMNGNICRCGTYPRVEKAILTLKNDGDGIK